MRVLVCGSRNYSDEEFIEKQLDVVVEDRTDVVIIHGGCRGVDAAADAIAKRRGWSVEVYYADFSLGRAGPKRNINLVTRGAPDHALFFLSRGKKPTPDSRLKTVERLGIPHNIFYHY